MSLADFLSRVVRILDGSDVPYMLTGSLASAYYAIPRATQDVDFVIAADEPDVDGIVQDLLALEWYVDREAAQEARRTRGQFNAIDPAAGWKVDFMMCKDREYSRIELQRRQRVNLLGVEVSIATLEDVLIAKMEWSRLGNSALQRRDVAQLLERTWDRLDRPYIERWIDELDLRGEWTLALRGVSRPDDQV